MNRRLYNVRGWCASRNRMLCHFAFIQHILREFRQNIRFDLWFGWIKCCAVIEYDVKWLSSVSVSVACASSARRHNLDTYFDIEFIYDIHAPNRIDSNLFVNHRATWRTWKWILRRLLTDWERWYRIWYVSASAHNQFQWNSKQKYFYFIGDESHNPSQFELFVVLKYIRFKVDLWSEFWIIFGIFGMHFSEKII